MLYLREPLPRTDVARFRPRKVGTVGGSEQVLAVDRMTFTIRSKDPARWPPFITVWAPVARVSLDGVDAHIETRVRWDGESARADRQFGRFRFGRLDDIENGMVDSERLKLLAIWRA